VGTLVWHKGVHVAIEALRELPADACTLTIVGDPATFPSYTADLRARAMGLPVTFAGRADRHRLADVYADFDVLVVPSLWLENSPLVIHEAFMTGVPVIGARIGGVADLIDHEVNGLLYEPPGSPAALAAMLRRVIDAPSVLSDFTAKLPVVKSMDDDVVAWESIYEEVIDRGVQASLVS
jgi:glycosyltransferase involved in cell wall biosynthesis